jgi:pimeloyl-ACP methyl ester carboxylesterase/DNA-binding SARP family transcriptional activator
VDATNDLVRPIIKKLAMAFLLEITVLKKALDRVCNTRIILSRDTAHTLFQRLEYTHLSNRIEINVLTAITVCRNGVNLPLVSSRKTRALLAYLAITGSPQRREHLCDMFFDNTNDPRASLRWSLSKLRATLNDGGTPRLVTENDTVALDMTTIDLDVHFVRAVHDNLNAPTDNLRQAAQLLLQKPLASLSLSDAFDYELWLLGECDDLQGLLSGVIQALVHADDVTDREAIKWLRAWHRFDPFSHDAPHILWQTLSKLHKKDDADAVARDYVELMGDDAKSWSPPLASPKVNYIKRQKIGFCKAEDGVKIAYATVGSGPPLVKAANWLNHLELDWDSPIWGKTFQALATNHTFIRYDERGNGLSDWDVADISFKSFLTDLETVVASQSLDRFPLLGMSQGCAVSIEYAVRYPEKVSALILIGGYASGWRIGLPPKEQEQREAVMTLTRLGWGTSNPAYRHIFSQTFMPNADATRLAWFDDFQRQTTTANNAVRFQEAFGDIDVRHLLSQVQAPTLVLHARGDQRIPLDCGRELAAEIPNARLVTLESPNHIILGDEPAWQVCMNEIELFLQEFG